MGSKKKKATEITAPEAPVDQEKPQSENQVHLEQREIPLSSTVEETPAPEPEMPIPPTVTIESLHQEIETLKIAVKELQDTLTHKRRPVQSNGKVQIKDKLTGKVYPSKNNAYQSLLKAGELKELVDKGVFGPDPAKNSFGCYTMFRYYPDRFEAVEPEKEQSQEQNG